MYSQALKGFQLRGEATHRLDSISDGVFALAIAMLLLSSSVPQHFDELIDFVFDAIPFFICMIFVFWIWQEQSTFFLRYGIYDDKVIRLNFGLLFFVLFYVFPLKFFMTWLSQYIIYGVGMSFDQEAYFSKIYALREVISWGNVPLLVLIYGIGFTSIFFILRQMYRYALQEQNTLELSKVELLKTKFKMEQQTICFTVGILSIIISGLGIIFKFYAVSSFLAGMIYNLIWILILPKVKQYKKTYSFCRKQE